METIRQPDDHINAGVFSLNNQQIGYTLIQWHSSQQVSDGGYHDAVADPGGAEGAMATPSPV